MTNSNISATPEARLALQKIIAEYGPVMFHTSGGRVGGRHFPICLPKEALRLGARDHLLGLVEGVEIYEMEDKDCGFPSKSDSYVLDVAPGHSLGFSIAASPGMRFTLSRGASSACEIQPQNAERC